MRIIFASHGDLSKGLLNSTKMLVGDLANEVETYSLYPGCNVLDYYEQLKLETENTNETIIILTDIKGGSVQTVLASLCQKENIFVLSGMNLAIAVEILLLNKESIGKIDIEKIVDNAKEGIELTHMLSNEGVDDDF